MDEECDPPTAHLVASDRVVSRHFHCQIGEIWYFRRHFTSDNFSLAVWAFLATWRLFSSSLMNLFFIFFCKALTSL